MIKLISTNIVILQLLFLVKNRRRISQSEIRNSAVAESEGGPRRRNFVSLRGRQKFLLAPLCPVVKPNFYYRGSKPKALLWGPLERSVWHAPTRRSLGAGGKRAVSSVPSVALLALAGRQNRFGFRQINAPFDSFAVANFAHGL